MYKPKYRKEVVLKVMTSAKVMETILFNPDNDGFFRVDSDAAPLAKLKYVSFLESASVRWGCWSIWYKGEEVGFILAAGIDCRLVGGVMSSFQRKGIYSAARQCVVKALNDLGQFSITSSYHKGNVKMRKLNEGVPTTPLYDSLVINHFDPLKPLAVMDAEFTINPTTALPTLYHLSTNSNLPRILTPRLPAGDENGGEFSEPNVPRTSFSPSAELCFRAIYPNHNLQLEQTTVKTITFTLYRAVPKRSSVSLTPLELHTRRWVHDAFITQEYVFLGDIEIEKVGTVTFENTSADKGLHYLPFNESKERYHSPLNIVKR